MKPKPQTTLLIPAYQEAGRIGKVLEVACLYPGASRVVVIDDGSREGTSQEASNFPVELVSLKDNRGKGAALQEGIRHAGYSDNWLFLDADLIGLKRRHLDALLQPLQGDGGADMTVGIFKGGRDVTDLAHRYFGILNGQRGLSGRFVSSLPDLSPSRFGVEILLSRYAALKGVPVEYPALPGLTHYTKEEKFGLRRGTAFRLQMYRECLYSLFFWKRYLSASPESTASGQREQPPHRQ